MRSSVPKFSHAILLIIILMLHGTSCSAQYQFQVICQKDDGQKGTVIDGKHYVGNTILWGLSDSGEPLFGASTQEDVPNGDLPTTLFLGNKAIAYDGVVIDGWTMLADGYGGSMASDGSVVIVNAVPDQDKNSPQNYQAFQDKYLAKYGDYYQVQVATGTSIPHFVALHHADPLRPENDNPKNQQMHCKCWVEGSRLTFDLESPSPQLSNDPAIKEQLKTPISVDWSKLLGRTVTAAQTYLDSPKSCIINKRGQILLSIIFTRGDPKQNAGWRNNAICARSPADRIKSCPTSTPPTTRPITTSTIASSISVKPCRLPTPFTRAPFINAFQAILKIYRASGKRLFLYEKPSLFMVKIMRPIFAFTGRLMV